MDSLIIFHVWFTSATSYEESTTKKQNYAYVQELSMAALSHLTYCIDLRHWLFNSVGTIEEKILELQKSKKALADSILADDQPGLRNLSREDLETLFS